MHKKGTFIFLNHCFHSQPKDICGQLATLFVICLAVLLVFIAVVVNLSKFISQKTRMTIAADSSALLLGSAMGSYAYKLSKEACGGGLYGRWYRSYALFVKIFLFVVGLILVLVGAICTFATAGLSVALIIAGAGLMAASLISWALSTHSDPKMLRILNKQLAKLPERYRYSEMAIQNAFSLTINDPNMIVDTYDYNKNGSTTDKISAFMKWQYERLEELAKGNDITNNQRAQRLANLYALSDLFEQTFIPRASGFGGYLNPEFKEVLTALKAEDELNPNISLPTQFFEEPPPFVNNADDGTDEEPLNRIDYLIQDIADITDPETIQSLLDVFHSPLSLESESGWKVVESLLKTLYQEWARWITDLNQWLEKKNEMKSTINNRLNDIEVRIGQINQMLACECCSYAVCLAYDGMFSTCSEWGEVTDSTCANKPIKERMPAISAEKQALEQEKERLTLLLPLIDKAITQTNAFKDDSLVPFMQALSPLIGEGSAAVPGRRINYSWNDSLGSHYVQVTVSGGWGIPYVQLESQSKWYGKKRRMRLYQYHGQATVTVERFDQPQQESFSSGLPLWNFRYAKELSGFGKYSSAATVEWGVFTGYWHLPRLIKVN